MKFPKLKKIDSFDDFIMDISNNRKALVGFILLSSVLMTAVVILLINVIVIYPFLLYFIGVGICLIVIYFIIAFIKSLFVWE